MDRYLGFTIGWGIAMFWAGVLFAIVEMKLH